MTDRTCTDLSDATLQRICAEYVEMPGLQLSLKQAQRLWGLDEDTCTRSLEYLVERRFLVRTTAALYARPAEARLAAAPRRMVKVSLDRVHAQRVERVGSGS